MYTMIKYTYDYFITNFVKFLINQKFNKNFICIFNPYLTETVAIKLNRNN